MAISTQKQTPAYLREARIKAGYISRGTAATVVPFSPETIGRHERGEREMEPCDALVYAECYQDPAILYRYCSDCPIGKKIGRTATERSLPYATLRVSQMIAQAQDVAARLNEIAFDGVIDAQEESDFRNAMQVLQELVETINDITLVGLTKDKIAPGLATSGERKKYQI